MRTVGIASGLAIIGLFAVFEKKRNAMNAWLDQLKDWGGLTAP